MIGVREALGTASGPDGAERAAGDRSTDTHAPVEPTAGSGDTSIDVVGHT